MTAPDEKQLRRLPSVDKVVRHLEASAGSERYSHERKVEAARRVLSDIRQAFSGSALPGLEEIAQRVCAALESERRAGLRPVVNATGIVLHTNLGRAVLPKEAMDAIQSLEGCCNLQINLESGKRGRRDVILESLMQTLTGAEAATIVNNNAGATLLVLAALCRNREVIVSRGQLIEIGGSFRLPDVIAQSGARMVEVGTTNKTHLRDYEAALTDETAVLLRVNPSNYRIIGFTEQVSTGDLVELKRKRRQDLMVVDDLGCGALVDLSEYGLPREPTVQDSIAAGADVALFSGDKLIGGPQAGIIVGRKRYIDLIRKHPLARALRVGKLTLAAMEATLKLFLNPDTLLQRHPTLRMLTLPYEGLQERAAALAERLAPYAECEVIEGQSACGGGAMPDTPLKTAVVALRHRSLSAEELARRLRLGESSVVSRIQEERVFLDVRTLLDGDEERIVAAMQRLSE